MALVAPETFDDHEVAMIYIAGRIKEGKRVEEVLSRNGVDYAVDAEPFEVLILGVLPVQYEGVGFYVLAERAESCRVLLRDAGLVQGLVEEDPDGP